MTQPLVSICIPTFQRSRYLASLLDCLVQQLAAFPYSHELVIADNASTDDTARVVRHYQGQLPIRYLRHDHNIGGYPNWQFVMCQGLGRYLVYLSDDDSLLGGPLADTIAKMEADPELAVVYAPWLLFDLVAQQSQGQFYSVPHDLRVGRDQHAQLLDHVLRERIFPEIAVLRRDVFATTMPRINAHAFWAFVNASDYLSQGAVLIQQQPFYVTVTRYFEDDSREQLGNAEVEIAWDRYRGGLEYMLARAGNAVGPEERAGFHLRVQAMIADRMAVAIRMRHAKKRGAIDNYVLAMRLRGMGYERVLPVPMDLLASQAMLEFLLRDSELNRGVRQMVCVGSSAGAERDYLVRESAVPVEFTPDLKGCDPLADTLLFMRGDAACEAPPDTALSALRNVRVVHERDLVARFRA